MQVFTKYLKHQSPTPQLQVEGTDGLLELMGRFSILADLSLTYYKH